ncbi:hypothetical protein OAF98_03435 [Planctomicrobium sp.]|jgi:hypothetical protein|nr:hypothetical protein [Planctomicrobium sp.]MBT5018209.1 hypothetical protein [Planctomicrobium sp.]MDA7528034.1 hypothetical protein [bacterium]MDB4743516.1 hypothetical protein [Planctomicrobium sp.]
MSGDFQISDEHRTWAANILNVDPQQSPAKLAELALQRLSTDDFVMWKQADVAVRVLAGTERTVWSASDFACLSDVTEQASGEEVEEFCQTFFELEPDIRKQHHSQLSEKCQRFPVLNLRLKQLIPGLELQPWSKQCGQDVAQENGNDLEMSDHIHDFGREVVRIFLAYPNERGEIERKLKQRWGDKLIWRRNTARDFSSQYPEYAKLAPGFVQRIQSMLSPSSRWRTRIVSLNQRQVTQHSDLTESETRWGYGTGIAIVFFFFLRVVFVGFDSKSSSSQYHPTYNSSKIMDGDIDFEDQDVQDGLEAMQIMQAYENRKRREVGNDATNGPQPNPSLPLSTMRSDGKNVLMMTESQLQEFLKTHPELKEQVDSQRGVKNGKQSKGFPSNSVLILKGNRQTVDDINKFKNRNSPNLNNTSDIPITPIEPVLAP